MEKYYQTVAEPRTYDLVEEYKRLFPDLGYRETVVENKSVCANFTNYLKKAEKELKVLSVELGVIV